MKKLTGSNCYRFSSLYFRESVLNLDRVREVMRWKSTEVKPKTDIKFNVHRRVDFALFKSLGYEQTVDDELDEIAY